MGWKVYESFIFWVKRPIFNDLKKIIQYPLYEEKIVMDESNMGDVCV
jgi:hypothetical protein